MTIKITFPNGDTFHIPAQVVAEARTKYYADLDGFEKGSKEWEEEYNQSMLELEDWLSNNMDWKDVKDYAIKVQNHNPDNYYDKAFFEAEISIKGKH